MRTTLAAGRVPHRVVTGVPRAKARALVSGAFTYAIVSSVQGADVTINVVLAGISYSSMTQQPGY